MLHVYTAGYAHFTSGFCLQEDHAQTIQYVYEFLSHFLPDAGKASSGFRVGRCLERGSAVSSLVPGCLYHMFHSEDIRP